MPYWFEEGGEGTVLRPKIQSFQIPEILSCIVELGDEDDTMVSLGYAF